MSPKTRKTLDLMSLKLELINSYRKNGRAGIERILDKYGQSAYLKRHKQYNTTVMSAENMCKHWLHELMVTNQP
jgi:hypothetical protein